MNSSGNLAFNLRIQAKQYGILESNSEFDETIHYININIILYNFVFIANTNILIM